MSGLVIPKEWNSEGVKSNPAANTILAQYLNESGSAESHPLHWVISSTIGGAIVFEHMEDDNTTVLRSHIFPIAASQPFESQTCHVTLDANQRVRLRVNALMLGSVQGTLFVE